MHVSVLSLQTLWKQIILNWYQRNPYQSKLKLFSDEQNIYLLAFQPPFMQPPPRAPHNPPAVMQTPGGWSPNITTNPNNNLPPMHPNGGKVGRKAHHHESYAPKPSFSEDHSPPITSIDSRLMCEQDDDVIVTSTPHDRDTRNDSFSHMREFGYVSLCFLDRLSSLYFFCFLDLLRLYPPPHRARVITQ